MTLVSAHQWEKVAFLIIDIVIIIIMHSHSRVKKDVSLSVLIYHISSKLFFVCWMLELDFELEVVWGNRCKKPVVASGCAPRAPQSYRVIFN